MLWENRVIDKYEKIKKLRKIIFKKLKTKKIIFW